MWEKGKRLQLVLNNICAFWTEFSYSTYAMIGLFTALFIAVCPPQFKILFELISSRTIWTQRCNKYKYWHDFECNLVLISTSKFFKDNRIAWAHRASAICNLWKICKCLLHQKEKVMKKKNYVITLLVMYLKKHCRKSRQTKFESVRAPFVTCTCATTLHSCYMRMRSFSANQKRVFFFKCTSLISY